MPVLGATDNGPILKPGISIPTDALDAWKVARALHSSQLVECVVFGDSTTSCEYVTGGWTRKLRDIAIAAGFTDGGRGVVGEGDNSGASGEALPILVSRTGFAAGGGSYDFLLTGTFVSLATSDTVTFQGHGTQCRIHYSRWSTTGQWSWAVDGGAATTVTDTLGTTLTELRSVLIPLGSAGLHTVTIVNLGGNPIDPPVLLGQSTDHLAGTLPPDTTYRYVATGVTAAGETLPSAEASITTAGFGGNENAFFITNIGGDVTSYNVYRVTGASGGTFQFLKNIAASGGAYTQPYDTGADTPAAPSPPVTNTAGLNTASNDVHVTPEFLRATGVVWHKQAISGIGMGSFFNLPTGVSPQNKAWAAATALGLASGSPPAYGDGEVDWSNAQASHPTYRHPALAILALGINNQQGSADSDEAWETARTVADGVGQFVKLCQAAGVSPLVVVPHFDYASNRVWSQRFRAAVWDTAVAMGVAVVDFNVALGPYNTGRSTWTGGPHINQAGYDAEAAWLWANVLSP